MGWIEKKEGKNLDNKGDEKIRLNKDHFEKKKILTQCHPESLKRRSLKCLKRPKNKQKNSNPMSSKKQT